MATSYYKPCTLGAADPSLTGPELDLDEGQDASDQQRGGDEPRSWCSTCAVSCILTPILAPAHFPKWLTAMDALEKHVGIYRVSMQVITTHLGPWLWILGFAFSQLLCWALTGDTIFGNATGGVVESLRLRAGLPMTWHMCCGSAMWVLGFVQIFFQQLRHSPLAWVHRTSGRLCLVLWSFVVGPTAGYLSLHVGAGRAKAHFFMALFALMGIDTTLCAYYYFWRALTIVRRRDLGDARFDLHSRAMRVGIGFTMLILLQRPMQLVFIGIRGLLLSLVSVMPALPVPAHWEVLHSFVETSNMLVGSVGSVCLDQHVILSVTTAMPLGVMLFLGLLVVDGPRSRAGLWLMSLKPGEEVAMFGSLEPGWAELLFWRLRVPAYIVLRMVVTRGWTQDPLPEKLL